MANPNAQAGAKPVPIPKFDGAIPYHIAAQNWLEAAEAYLGDLENVDRARIKALACYAFRDNAAHWFRGYSRSFARKFNDWHSFSTFFKEQWCDEEKTQSEISAEEKSLTLGPNEGLQRFMSRCVTAGLNCAQEVKPKDNETPAQAAEREIINEGLRSKWVQQKFINGIPTIIADRLLERDNKDVFVTLKNAISIATKLRSHGKYRDPASSYSHSTANSNAPGTNPSFLSTQVAAVDQSADDDHAQVTSLAGQLRQAGLGPLADLMQQNNSTVASAARNGRGRGGQRGRGGRGRGRGGRSGPSKDYTPGATCSYCHKQGHTESQCYSKKNAQGRANGHISAITYTSLANHSAPSSKKKTVFWVGAGKAL